MLALDRRVWVPGTVLLAVVAVTFALVTSRENEGPAFPPEAAAEALAALGDRRGVDFEALGTREFSHGPYVLVAPGRSHSDPLPIESTAVPSRESSDLAEIRDSEFGRDPLLPNDVALDWAYSERLATGVQAHYGYANAGTGPSSTSTSGGGRRSRSTSAFRSTRAAAPTRRRCSMATQQ